jgi:hypothetical protein
VFQGEVETETITEYREVTDDADFGNFGQLDAQRDLAKGRILANAAARELRDNGIHQIVFRTFRYICRLLYFVFSLVFFYFVIFFERINLQLSGIS